ncbi:MAG: efflux RND transporter permease subunit [Planctomycetes bacterium]|nr:efflux RND transporter permease subunit [Planctomycetota bacterium]
MWLVNLALKSPYTIFVAMMLTVVLGVLGYVRTPTDILPKIKVPVVVVFASYRGMPAPDMEKSVTAVLERALTRCDHLQHIESKSLLGIGIIKVYFREQVDPDVAASQVISLVNGEMQNMPPGMLPPSVLKFDASAIPVGNLIITSNRRTDKELLDIADYQLREELAGIEGLASAPVFGGVFRQVQIYVHPRSLESLKLSPLEVARIVNQQSQIIPTGEIRIGDQNYYVISNSMVGTPKDFEKIPLYNDGRKIVHLGDVANVVDATRWRTNTVHVDGKRAVYMPLLRQAGASAITVVDNVKAFLPELHERGAIPDDVQVEIAFDQSQYVRDAIANLRLEAALGAVLASLVVLLFLGSLRSTWIVMLSIPLSVLMALAGLYFTGATLNIMTLGGLALILGRVVDDCIVDVENTVRHLEMGKNPLQAVRDSSQEISLPVLIATVTTVVVFFPLTLMSGIGRHLFVPLAISASLAMGASYLVARTVSPLYNSRFLRAHAEGERFPSWLIRIALFLTLVGLGLPALAHYGAGLLDQFFPRHIGDTFAWPYRVWPAGVRRALVAVGALGALVLIIAGLARIAPVFHRLFERCTQAYERSLRWCLHHRLAVLGLLAMAIVMAAWCFPRIGQELFPEVDSSEFTVHLRAAGGPRVETTENKVHEIEQLIRDIVPTEDLKLTLANIGLSSRWSAIYTSNNGPHAAFIRVQLRSGFDGRTTPTGAYVEELRQKLEKSFPSDDFFFETGGMIRQILNGGALAPIEVHVHGKDMNNRRAVAKALDWRIGRIPQVKETYLPQAMDLPQLKIEVDRTAAARLKLTQTDVVRNVITSLMSSAQLAPNFWIDPKTGNPYIIGVQYPEDLVEDIQTLETVPITPEKGGTRRRAPLLRDLATIERGQGPVEVFHYEADRVSQLFVSVGDNDLARVAGEIDRIVEELPLTYAITVLPRDALLAHALKVFPAEKGNPRQKAKLQRVLKAYFHDEDPEVANELREEFGISVDSLHLGKNQEFKARLGQFLAMKKGKEQARADLQRDFGVDPEPLRLPRGVRVTVRGEVASMRESFSEMGINLLLAVLLVYLVMVAQFASWLDPFIMIVAAPLGLVGVAVTLWATSTSLNIQSSMGVLLMVGISVSNSVLLVDFANRLREEGMRTFDAVVWAARTRLRPIVMTTVATVAGLLPMAIHLHPGDEMNLPLARAVIGGLTGSTLLTLFVVPVLYMYLKPADAQTAETPAS